MYPRKNKYMFAHASDMHNTLIVTWPLYEFLATDFLASLSSPEGNLDKICRKGCWGRANENFSVHRNHWVTLEINTGSGMIARETPVPSWKSCKWVPAISPMLTAPWPRMQQTQKPRQNPFFSAHPFGLHLTSFTPSVHSQLVGWPRTLPYLTWEPSNQVVGWECSETSLSLTHICGGGRISLMALFLPHPTWMFVGIHLSMLCVSMFKSPVKNTLGCINLVDISSNQHMWELQRSPCLFAEPTCFTR